MFFLFFFLFLFCFIFRLVKRLHPEIVAWNEIAQKMLLIYSISMWNFGCFCCLLYRFFYVQLRLDFLWCGICFFTLPGKNYGLRNLRFFLFGIRGGAQNIFFMLCIWFIPLSFWKISVVKDKNIPHFHVLSFQENFLTKHKSKKYDWSRNITLPTRKTTNKY